MIEARGLTKRYGDIVGVADVSFRVGAGEIFGLLGPNGAGKTTTMRMLATLLTPSEGDATVAGRRLGDDDEGIRANLGYLPENPGLYERLTAMENLVYFGQLHGLTRAESARRASLQLKSFDLEARANDRVSGYSKGMRQKLALARALLHEPQVLLLDEPTSGLDPEAAASFRERIRAMKASGRAIVLSTHRLEEAEQVCDAVGIVKTKLLAERRIGDLTGGGAATAIRVTFARESQDAIQKALLLPGVSVAKSEGLQVTFDLSPVSPSANVVRCLIEGGAEVSYVEPVKQRLEDFYLSLVSGAGAPRKESA